MISLLRELQQFELPMNPELKPPEEIGLPYMTETRKWCTENAGVMLVASEDARLVGYACVLTDCKEEGKSGERPYHYAHVADLVVTATMRGRGIGKALLTECERLSRAKGQTILRIGVMAENAGALGLYHAFGFRDRHQILDKRLT